MWVEAILAKNDLEKAMSDFCPLSLKLGEDGAILLTDPRSLELVPDVGLRLKVTGEVHWPILGIQIPVSVRSATLEVKPEIVKNSEGEKLTFKVRLDDVDISMLPDLVDRGIVDRVNQGLEAKHVELSWNFIRTLRHVFALPEALASAGAIALSAGWGRVKITSDALVLAVSFDASVEPRGVESHSAGAPASSALALPDRRPGPVRSESVRSLWRRSPGSLALVVGSAWLAGMGLSALLFARRRRAAFRPWRELPRT